MNTLSVCDWKTGTFCCCVCCVRLGVSRDLVTIQCDCLLPPDALPATVVAVCKFELQANQ